jgi:hypothetical protein
VSEGVLFFMESSEFIQTNGALMFKTSFAVLASPLFVTPSPKFAI